MSKRKCEQVVHIDASELIPGGPHETIVHRRGERLTPEQLEAIRARSVGNALHHDGSVSCFLKPVKP